MAEQFPLRILLVEDNPMNQKLILLIMQKFGYKIDVANNGLEAIDTLQAETYDMILMDVQMPEMDGREATRTWRSSDGGATSPTVPIVALTAHVGQEERDACVAAGMDDYLSKPFGIDALATVCRRWLSVDQAGSGVER
jgi:CheY-like chemotaxis protein